MGIALALPILQAAYRRAAALATGSGKFEIAAFAHSLEQGNKENDILNRASTKSENWHGITPSPRPRLSQPARFSA
jgi:hypothetical protein